MARTVTAALLCALAAAVPASASQVLEYEGGGRLVPHENPYLPPASGPEAALTGSEQACPAAPPAARDETPPAAATGASVTQAIDAADRRGQITSPDAAAYKRIYGDARSARARLGTWRGELSSVIGTLEGISRRGLLTSGRMPALFLQLRRNTEFWSGNPKFPPRPDVKPEPCTAPPGRSGSRITFPDSKLVFQYYPGSGLQIQPLGNFGMANGMITECRRVPENCDRPGLKQLLDELVAIRSSRGGFITWEYWFYFGGGTPPWTSGLSQATALQALSRASEQGILNDKSYLRVARSALGVFQKPPPVGVRVKTDGGSHYLIYSFAPGQRVLNGFLQAITGLYDFARIAQNPTARALYKAGDRAARRELRRFDTGAWSLYSEGGAESSGGYHQLVTTFLGNVCKRLHARYCTYRDRFRRYAQTPPRLRYTGRAATKAGRPLVLAYTVDKVSCVTAVVTNAAGKRSFRARLKVARGAHSVTWRPRARGSYTLSFEALDPLKNKRVVTRALAVR